jgi:hypothetical protein
MRMVRKCAAIALIYPAFMCVGVGLLLIAAAVKVEGIR